LSNFADLRCRKAFSAAALDRVDADDAPVFAALATDDGGSLALRRIDGEPYRPILAPGAWRPVGEAEFRAAVRDGVAMRDNPFRHKPSASASAMAVDELSALAETSFAGTPAEADAALARTAMAGRLVVVDGIVHRRTVEPTVEIVATDETLRLKHYDQEVGRRWRLAWKLGDDLAQTDPQSAVARPSGRRPFWELSPLDKERGDPAYEGGRPGLSWPLARMSEALDVFAAMAAYDTEHRLRPRIAESGTRVDGERGRVVEDSRPPCAALEPAAEDPVGALAALEESGALGRLCEEVDEGTMSNACASLRAAVETGADDELAAAAVALNALLDKVVVPDDEFRLDLAYAGGLAMAAAQALRRRFDADEVGVDCELLSGFGMR
jgi:hypothetical protein